MMEEGGILVDEVCRATVYGGEPSRMMALRQDRQGKTRLVPKYGEYGSSNVGRKVSNVHSVC